MAEAIANTSPELSLYDAYHQYFEVIPATTRELQDEAFKLRYHVYCVEHSFENPDRYPDQREVDEYDPFSVHSLLIHKPTGTIAGTVRLVLPDSARSSAGLPIDSVCHDPSFTSLPRELRQHMGEVSRFAVSRSFRRRIGEGGSPSGVTDESLAAMLAMRRDMKDRRLAPHITLGLIHSLVVMSAENDVLLWSSVMERALLRLLTRIGIHFTNLGPEVRYRGKRQPCFTGVAQMLAGVKRERFDVWEVVTDKGRVSIPAPESEALFA